MSLINFLNIEACEKRRFQVVINSLENDRITPLVKNIFNRLKEVDSRGGEDKLRREAVRASVKMLVEDSNFLVMAAGGEQLTDPEEVERISD